MAIPASSDMTPQKIFLGKFMLDSTFFEIRHIIIIASTKIIVTVIKIEDEVLIYMFPIIKSFPVTALYTLTGIKSIRDKIKTIQLYFSFIINLHC